MTAPAAAPLINLLGYITGAVLYAMLLVMALGRQRIASSIGLGGASSEKTDRLPLLTAALGLAWNLGALTAFVMQNFASVHPFPLTTIGYLIQTAPDRALETLMRLTQLLRGVLRRSEGEFATLGEEIELIESYLDIESARFEDRLRVMIDVPSSLRQIRVPALLIQPLVENAIKHGVSPCRAGGEVVILARLAHNANRTVASIFAEDTLQIWVRDTGVGASEQQLAHGRESGIGLQNVEQRIKRHYGGAATFDIRSATGVGTTVELGLPVNRAKASGNEIRAQNLQQTSARLYG